MLSVIPLPFFLLFDGLASSVVNTRPFLSSLV